MNTFARYAIPLVLLALFAGGANAAPPWEKAVSWSTVVNNHDYMPTTQCHPQDPEATSPPCRHFNSYNQPSVNAAGLVVFRARSKGGGSLGEPVQGIYTHDMAAAGPISEFLDRQSLVPQPNNRGSAFTETPSFPRIDINTSTIVVRGNHQPVWQVVDSGGTVVEQAGTSGIYTDAFGKLIAAASKLGGISYFSFFQVPESRGTYFDVFPGAPAVTNGNVIAFKGNYTAAGLARTGVYYRDLADSPIYLPDRTALAPAGSDLPLVLIANNVDTLVPGTNTVFGSVAPPSAADGLAVFAGFDNEDAPTLGGIYLARLNESRPPLKTLVAIGERVPGQDDARFNQLGEAISFDGRFVAFWGAWGNATTSLNLKCPAEGNKARVAYCNAQYPDGFTVHIPVHQGVFVYDIQTEKLQAVATAPEDFTDFLFWNFSGHTPGDGEGDGEPARWRSSAFLAVSSPVRGTLVGAHYHVAFKARTGVVTDGSFVDPVDGIYLAGGPGRTRLQTLIHTGAAGTLVDPEAIDTTTGSALPITEVGLERDGLRGRYLVINASMGDEDTGWAGIYMAHVPQ